MKFIEKLKDYVLSNEDFDVVNIAGSYADKKSKNRNDEISDVDIFIITESKDYYLNNPEWVKFYREKFIYFNDPISLGIGSELRIAYDDGLLVDIAIVNDHEFKLLKQNSIFCEKILDRGYDNIKNLKGEQYFKHKSFEEKKINEYTLNRKIDEFWIDIANIYKHLKRGDVFSAKYAFDRRITKLLIFAMEEYTKTINKDIDIMFNGRKMHTWLDIVSYKEIMQICSSMNELEMVLCIDRAIVLFGTTIDQIFDFYKYKMDSQKNAVISCLKTKINDYKIICEVANKILNYNYGKNNDIIKKMLFNKVEECYKNKEKLSFVIPAFPGKSPNKNSSFSSEPGYTENLAIDSIKKFIKEIKSIYPYNVEFVVVHDGHFFFNLGITRSEKELNDYVDKLRKKFHRVIKSKTIYDLMREDNLRICLEKFNSKYLEDTVENMGLSKEILFTKYEFYEQINNYCMSKNQVQMNAKRIAIESLKIKKAVCNMIDHFFPKSIRLSVHYQEEDSIKMGFKLIPTAVNKGTPWFYVAYLSEKGRIVLGKRNWNFKSKKVIKKKQGKFYVIKDNYIDSFLNNNTTDKIKKEKEYNR